MNFSRMTELSSDPYSLTGFAGFGV